MKQTNKNSAKGAQKDVKNVLTFTEKEFNQVFNQANKEDLTPFFAVFKLLQFAQRQNLSQLFDAIKQLVVVDKGFNYKQASNNQLRKIADSLILLQLFEKHLPHLSDGTNYTFASEGMETTEQQANNELANLPEGCQIVENENGSFSIFRIFTRKKIVGEKIEVIKENRFISKREKYTINAAFTVIKKELKAKKLFATVAKEKAPQKTTTTTDTAAKKDAAQNEIADKIDKKSKKAA